MMMRKQFFILFLGLSLFAMNGNVLAQQVAKMSPKGTGFLQYLPDGYSSNTNKYPIVISLHGIKEKGNTLTDVARVANVGLPKYVKYGQKYPFILISPQLKTTMGRWSGAYVMEVLNYVKTYLRVDPNRIYLTGLSLGGGGVWSVATSYPDVWASILPVCSGYNLTSLAYKIAGSKIPTWGFHGDADAVVSEGVTIAMINAINNYKPTPLAKLTIFPGMGHVIWDKVYKETSALSWMLSYTLSGTSTSTSTTTNRVPVANAGSDRTLTLPSNSTSLFGSGTDSDGSIVAYAWSKKSGSTATLSGTTSKELKLSNLVAGTYTFTLKVKDDKGAYDTDDVVVTVKSSSTSTTTTNRAPIVSAGSNKLVVLPSNSLAITASAKDYDGTIKSYSWSKLSGPSAYMYNQTTSTLKLSSLVSGTYTFRVTVKDDKGASAYDDVTVNVTKAPVVNAGSDKTITLPYASLTLTATATDYDGTIASWQWSKSSGPSVLSMSNSSTSSVKLTNMQQGTYVLKLAVKDNKGAVGYDYVRVVVNGSTASIEWNIDPKTVVASL
jgi:hypothetical protein